MSTAALQTYILRGGEEGRARLATLSRVLAPTTGALLDRFEPLSGAHVVDVGCGGGHVTFELARRAGPDGRVVGLDLDEIKLAHARDEADRLGLHNVEFRCVDVLGPWGVEGAALVYVRFVLTHLSRPERLLARAHAALAPGGTIVVEDIDYAGEFCDPPNRFFSRYAELFVAAARHNGANPFIGPALHGLLEGAAFADAASALVQPFGRAGDVKRISLLTMIGISDMVIRTGIAHADEVAEITNELAAFVERPDTTVGLPRIFQAWARRPSAGADA